jgi:hypothetical protein
MKNDIPWWVLPVLSYLWTAVFAVALAWACLKGDNNAQNLMIGSLITQVTGIIGFWFGSSHGSQQKDATIQQALAATPGPAP